MPSLTPPGELYKVAAVLFVTIDTTCNYTLLVLQVTVLRCSFIVTALIYCSATDHNPLMTNVHATCMVLFGASF